MAVLSKDQARARRVFHWFILDRGYVNDVYFLGWLEAYKLRGNLFMPKKLGNIIPVSKTPSILFVSRVHAWLNRKRLGNKIT